MYSIPLLTQKLVELAEESLPKFSGQEKVLQVLIKFIYKKEVNAKPSLGVTNSEQQYIKVVFWHPNNAMLVGYDFETMVENIFDQFAISSNHSSTWKSEGLNFFHKILLEPNDWKIEEVKILDIEPGSALCQPSKNSENGEFVFKAK